MGFVEMFNVFAKVAGVFISTMLIANHSGVCASYDYSYHRVCDDDLASSVYGSLPLRDFIKDLKLRDSSEEKENSQVVAIKASGGTIRDGGFIDLMREFDLDKSADFLPHLLILDLSSNRITVEGLTQSYKGLDKLLRRDSFSFLDIKDNRAATIDAKDFFSKLPSDLLKKIIWIHENHLKAMNWVVVIDGRNSDTLVEDVSIIIKSHELYFQKPPEYKNKFDLFVRQTLLSKKEEADYFVSDWSDFLSALSELKPSSTVKFMTKFIRECKLEDQKETTKLELGKALYQGNGINVNKEKAAKIFFTLGNEAKDPLIKGESLCYLSKMYREGDYFPINDELSDKYDDLAYQVGFRKSL